MLSPTLASASIKFWSSLCSTITNPDPTLAGQAVRSASAGDARRDSPASGAVGDADSEPSLLGCLHKMPFRSASSERASDRESSLLLVVHRGALDVFALRICSARGDRAGLAIGRHDNPTASSGLAGLLDV